MEHAVSIDRSAICTTQNERLEALKRRFVPTPDSQQEHGDGDLNKITDRCLHEATKKRDVEKFIDELEKLSESRKLALSLIFDQVTPSRNSLLHAAARLEDLKARCVQTPDNQHQLRDGDLNKIMDRDLYEATKEGDVEKFINALEKVSESRKLALSLIIDQVTPSGNSLLHVAANFGKIDVMELILIHFPNMVTQKNSSEDTALHVAVQDGRFNAIEKLIRLGTDSEIIYQKNKDSISPLYLATEKCECSGEKLCEGERWKILQLLLQESARDEAYAVKIQGTSPVLAALKKSNKDILKEIIDQLPKLLHVRDENGWTPLHAAAWDGNVEAMEILLSKCPYLALQTDKNGSYPIHIACERKIKALVVMKVTLVKLHPLSGTIGLLIKETWPDLAEIKNKKGQNILHVAAKAGSDDAVQCILELSSEPVIIEKLVNSKDVDGNTPLHLASMHNHCEVMRSLTKVKGICSEHCNNDGLTALDVAMISRSLSTENPVLLGRAILIVAGILQSEDRDILSLREQGCGESKSSPVEWIKDRVNTLLLVATLVASVTFTAGVTLPGGYNSSSDPHPGTATMLHKGMFQLFVISNMLAMYSSILAVVVLLWGLSRDFYVAELAYHSAGPLLLMALIGMSVAFLAAVIVAVSKLTWLGNLVLSVGVLYLTKVVVVLSTLIFPSSKSAMRIVVLYYMAVSKVKRFVKSCVWSFGCIMFIGSVSSYFLCYLLLGKDFLVKF